MTDGGRAADENDPGPEPGPGPDAGGVPGQERDRERGADPQPVSTEAGTGPRADDSGAAGLSERDVAVLAFERRGWPGPGVKERAIREQLDLSPARYYQLLNALLDDPHALAHDPVTVNRLRRVRESRRSRR